MSAEERREDALAAAVSEFAVRGLHGTSTETIAARAGISQPYLFRLFGTKKGLFLAAVERGFDRVRAAFTEAAGKADDSSPAAVLGAMGDAYRQMVADRQELLLQMQGYAACADDDVRRLVQRRYADLYRHVTRLSGADDDTVTGFFARGMLLNVVAAMDLPSVLTDKDWVNTCLGSND